MGERQYKAICFDLDGTLLPMDVEDFMRSYFKRICEYAQAHGLDGRTFMAGMDAGTKAMAASHAGLTNKEVFWRAFDECYGPSPIDIHKMADEFYVEDFPKIAEGFKSSICPEPAIEMLRDKGYPIVLATMPMFPYQAVIERLKWANVDPSLFDRITCYENSGSIKPKESYYREVLDSIGVEGEDVLMIGNNTLEDLSFMDLGADAYLVTDFLIDPMEFDMSSVKHGTFSDFERWAEGLPKCESPASGISQDGFYPQQSGDGEVSFTYYGVIEDEDE